VFVGGTCRRSDRRRPVTVGRTGRGGGGAVWQHRVDDGYSAKRGLGPDPVTDELLGGGGRMKRARRPALADRIRAAGMGAATPGGAIRRRAERAAATRGDHRTGAGPVRVASEFRPAAASSAGQLGLHARVASRGKRAKAGPPNPRCGRQDSSDRAYLYQLQVFGTGHPAEPPPGRSPHPSWPGAARGLV